MGRVVCALANGTVAVFKRDPDGQWDLTKYHSVCLGSDKFAVRCLAVVNSRVWCGYKNKIHVLEPKTLTVLVSERASTVLIEAATARRGAARYNLLLSSVRVVVISIK